MGESLGEVLSFLEEQEIEIIPLSAEQHDQKMARSQAVAFLFGKIGLELGLERNGIDTPGYEHLLANQEMVAGDSEQLFEDMFAYNRFAREMIAEVEKVVSSIVYRV